MIEMAAGEAGAWKLGFAGDTLNTLWYARSGLDPAAGALDYASALGDDSFSGRMVAFLERHGIGTGHIARLPGRRPGLYLIEQREGDRHFAYWREASAARSLADDEARLARAVDGARAVYFSGITLAILAPQARERLFAALSRARQAGSLLAFDPNIRPALWEDMETGRAAILRAAGLAHIVLPSFDDEAAAFGDADPATTARRYRAAGAAEIVVKDGARAVTILAGESLDHVLPPAGVKPVDATAAGDSFNGAYLAARLGEQSAARAARAGCRMAAAVVVRHGALIHAPDMERWNKPAPQGA
nr:sugar kinase [Aureimonas populi]